MDLNILFLHFIMAFGKWLGSFFPQHFVVLEFEPGCSRKRKQEKQKPIKIPHTAWDQNTIRPPTYVRAYLAARLFILSFQFYLLILLLLAKKFSPLPPMAQILTSVFDFLWVSSFSFQVVVLEVLRTAQLPQPYSSTTVTATGAVSGVRVDITKVGTILRVPPVRRDQAWMKAMKVTTCTKRKTRPSSLTSLRIETCTTWPVKRLVIYFLQLWE